MFFNECLVKKSLLRIKTYELIIKLVKTLTYFKNKIFKSAQLNILIFNQKRTKKVPHVNQEKKLTISNRIY